MPPQAPYVAFPTAGGAVQLGSADLTLDDLVDIINAGALGAVTSLRSLQAFLGVGDSTVCANYAALIALTVRPAYVLMQGYLAAGDGGGGIFFWVANSTTTADSGLIVQCTSGAAGRYKRLFTGSISPKWFGCGLGAANDSVQFAKVIAAGYAIDASGCTLPVKNLNITSSTTCPGIFSDGSGSFVPPTGSVYPDLNFNVSKDDFYFDNVFFNMPISATATRPAFDRGIYFRASGLAKRWHVRNCRFLGGNGSFSFAGICQDVSLTNSLMESTWTDAVDINAPINCVVEGNIFKAGCLWDGAGTLAISGSSVLGATKNLNITGNVFQDCGINNPANLQDAIDLYGIAIQNCVISDNVVDNCGSGFELKTSQGTPAPSPDVYNNFDITGNVIRLTNPKSGISLNLTSPLPPVTDRTGRILIASNYITSDTMPTTGDHYFGISVTGAYFDVSLTGNYLLNLNRGIQLGSGAAGAGATSSRVTIIGNTIEVTDIGIQGAGILNSVINNLNILGNRIRSSADRAIRLLSITMNDLIVSGNYIESTLETAMQVSDAQNAEISRNTFRGHFWCLETVTDAFNPCGTVVVQDNSMWTDPTTGLDACRITTGTAISILNNAVRVPIARRVVSGAGTYVAAGNTRGTVTADPSATIAGSLGDIFQNSAPASGGFEIWICTTAGNAAAATYKGGRAIA